MIIDKVRAQLTKEEREELDNITIGFLDDNRKGLHKHKEAWEVLTHVYLESKKAIDKAKKRYREEVGGKKDLLLQDLEDIAQAITKEDHYYFIERNKAIFDNIEITNEELKKAGGEPSRYLEVAGTDTPESARLFLQEALDYPYRIYKELYKDGDADRIIQRKIEEWYPAIKFKPLKQGELTNAMAMVTKGRMKEDRIADRGIAKKQDIQITLDNFDTTSLSLQQQRIFDFIVLKHTETGDKIVSIPISEFMEKCGLKDRKEARAQLKKAVDTLYAVSISGTAKNRNNNKATVKFDFRVLQGKGDFLSDAHRGAIAVMLSDGIIEYLDKNAYPMDFNTDIFRIPIKDQSPAYRIARRLTEHKNINAGKKTENRISVKTLLEAIPEIPTYDEVMASNRHVKDRIIDPFEKGLIYLKKVGILNDYHYCKTNGKTLPNEEVIDYSYDTWSKWNLEFDLKYPDQTERIEKERKERKARKKKAEQRKEKAKLIALTKNEEEKLKQAEKTKKN